MPAATASAAQPITEYPLPTGYIHPSSIVSAGGSSWYLSSTHNGSTDTLSSVSTSGSITNYSIVPTGGGGNISGLAVDSSGNVWFSGCVTPATGPPGIMELGYMNATTNALTTFLYSNYVCEYAITNWSVGPLTVDVNGNVWVDMYYGTSTGHSSVVGFTPSGAQFSVWSPTGGNQDWEGIVAGPSNSLWTVDSRYGKVAQLTLSPTTGAVTGMNEYAAPGTLVGSITVGPDGNLWVAGSGTIYKMDTSGVFTSYAVPSGATVQGITTGPDGALWFTGSTNNVGRATTGGSITEYAISTAGAGAAGITTGPDGAVWFTETSANKIGRMSADPFMTEYPISTGYISPTTIVTAGGSTWYLNSTHNGSVDTLSSISSSGAIANYSVVPSGGGSMNGLSVDPSGNIWFAGCVIPSTGPPGILELGSMNPSTLTLTTHTYTSYVCRYSITQYSIGQPAADASGNIWVDMWNNSTRRSSAVEFTPSGALKSTWFQSGGTQNWSSFVAGPNNSLWAYDGNNNQIDQLTLDATTDTVTGMNAYTPPSGAYPSSLTGGPDGNLWFVDSGHNTIQKMTPSGTFTSYSVPTGYIPDPTITAGSDGAMWFNYRSATASYIGRITTSGSITGYQKSTSSTIASGIAVSSNGTVWFTEGSVGKIGRLGY